jgi:GTPase Era involved in 16S rRNA processing
MYIGVTGTRKSTMINEFNGEKISYYFSENHVKTKGNLLFKNRKYQIINQDIEGFEIADNWQIGKVNDNNNKNIGDNFNERLHIVIYLLENNRGLDKTDLPLIIKLHKMKILHYILWPKEDGKDEMLKGKANRLLISIKELIKNKDNEPEKIFQDFKNKKN